MCGIVGIFCKNKASVEAFREGVNASLDVIRHRGPDDRGILVHNNIILGHVRLSIIDLTRDGHQPMISSDNRYVITYNGEVYNYKDLKQEISHKDINYRSNTDTEVILEYFKLHGVAMFSKLNGMFAFSVIDKKNQKAYLVRDRFGIKPLYYYKDKNVKIIEYPPEKDKTDLELAFLYAAQKKVNEIIVIGALGKRWDMTFANILIPFLPELKNISIRFIDDKTEITVLFGNNKKKFSGKKGDIFSIIPISSEALGVTLSGFKYPLKNANIKIGATIGISNIFLEEKAEVSIKKGRLLCIHERGN